MSDIFFKDTVTIWNRFKGSGTWDREEWYPTVIQNARILISRGNNIMKSGNSSADSVRLHISDTFSTADKAYADPDAWKTLDKSGYYTLVCDDMSFFTEGDTSSEDLSSVDNALEYMKENHYKTFLISNVDRFELIPHWEVWGK